MAVENEFLGNLHSALKSYQKAGKIGQIHQID